MNYKGGITMNKINWKQKLSSRKFWAAVVGFVTAHYGADFQNTN